MPRKIVWPPRRGGLHSAFGFALPPAAGSMAAKPPDVFLRHKLAPEKKAQSQLLKKVLFI
jgi:hypothetical protein